MSDGIVIYATLFIAAIILLVVCRVLSIAAVLGFLLAGGAVGAVTGVIAMLQRYGIPAECALPVGIVVIVIAVGWLGAGYSTARERVYHRSEINRVRSRVEHRSEKGYYPYTEKRNNLLQLLGRILKFLDE
jgi:LytS/YehU family sensor histidine kinase